MKKIAGRKILTVAALASFTLPIFALAAISIKVSVHGTRSDTRMMGSVPYYVYGYDVKVNTATVAEAVPPPVAPKLPIAGAGGRLHSHKTSRTVLENNS